MNPSPPDPELDDLIDQGEALLRRIERSKAGDRSEKLHLQEYEDWVKTAERWAFARNAAIPEKGNNLDYVLGWEDPADAYVLRLVERLKTYASAAHEDVAPASRPGESVPRAGHIFVSYVREDSDAVQRLRDDLETYGVNVWLDRDAITPGLRWKQAIRKAVREGAFFIACFSAASVERDRTYMNEELVLAIEEVRQRASDTSWFIPVKLSSCELPDVEIGAGATLSDIQSVDLHLDWDAGIRRIVDVVAPLPPQLRVWLDLLELPDDRERRSTAEALARKPDRRAFRSLVRALDDRDRMVVYWAARALAAIGDPRAVPALVRALRTGRQYDYKVVEVLEGFHTGEAAVAVESYKKMRADPDPWAYARWLGEGDEESEGS